MANPSHLDVFAGGTEAIARWRANAPDEVLDLSHADLTGREFKEKPEVKGADLRRASFFNSNLQGLFLTGANLRDADLRLADLTDTDFTRADLSGANLECARMEVSYLKDAKLRRANLRSALLVGWPNLAHEVLSGADFTDAVFRETVVTGVDLSHARGLEAVKHEGPTSIGIDTLYRSSGKIPVEFLRGCGVPEALITYLPDIVASDDPIQFYSCFISYSHSDEEFCKQLHARMRKDGLRVWFAPEDIAGGKKIHEQIERAIRVYDKLVVVLSEASMKSQWVATEIYHAFQREHRENRRILFPIRLVPFDEIVSWKCFDADTGKDMARGIREYFIPDFARWRELPAFEEAYGSLVRDLRTSAE